uniref:Sleeping Beauty transposase HTH domain-containing protein n=1 Tax=Fundulus heteroclitus TaxID=8078 RepID=A0A3Q2P0U1_FUNHE
LRSKTNDIPIGLRSEIVALHNAGKGYRLISKTLQIPDCTVRNIVRKWKRFNTVASLSWTMKHIERTQGTE